MDKIRQQLLDRTSRPSGKKQSQDKQKSEEQAGSWMDSPWTKATGIFILSVGLLWASSFFFSALNASVKSFKKLSRSVKE
jgi:hypothetical protein